MFGGEPEEASLLNRDVRPADRHASQPEATGGDETLVATDDGSVITTDQHRLDEAELAETAFEGVELLLADPPRVGGIRAEIIDRNEFDCNGNYVRRAPVTPSA